MVSQTNNKEAYDIYIGGLGITPSHHMTREVETVIRRSKEVFFLSNSYGCKEYLETLCPKVTDLYSLSYKEGSERLDAYNTMSATVINAALNNSPVSFVLYGHPSVFCYPPRQILQAAQLLGLKVKVLPGISSMDCIFSELNLDPGLHGLQMYEATDLLLRQRPLQPDVPCLIWQVGTVESVLYSKASNKPERFSRILNHLLKYYPSDHKIGAIFVSTYPLAPTKKIVFRLDEIESQYQYLHQGVTLYIPPINIRPIADKDLLEEIESVVHLRKLTNSPIE